jgi:hypothetical protein
VDHEKYIPDHYAIRNIWDATWYHQILDMMQTSGNGGGMKIWPPVVLPANVEKKVC